MPNITLENQLDKNAKPLKVDDKSLPLEVSEDKLFYQKTPSKSYELANKKYVDDNAGGTDTWTFQTGARWQSRENNWYFANSSYGFNFYIWSTSLSSTSLPTEWADNRNPNIIVPKNLTFKSYKARGYFSSNQTYQLALLTGTPSYGSAGNTYLSQVGSTQSLNATANIQNEIGEDGLSVSMAAGDMLLPAFRRTTSNTTANYYFYFNLTLVGEYT